MELAFDFKSHPCKQCLNLDYEQQPDGGWIRRSSTPTRGQIPLKLIPHHLVKKIIEKMNQQSFSRMRRTVKWITKFIQDNREKLRIAIFHHFKIIFNPSFYKDDVHVSFVYPRRVIYEKIDNDDQEYESDFGPLEDFQSEDFGKFSGMVKRDIVGIDNNDYVERPAVTISLKAWKNDPDFRRELMGVYHGDFIHFGSFETIQEVELICEFMKFAGLTGKKLEVEEWPDQCLRTLCKSLKPVGLCDKNSRHEKDIFMQEGFETIKELILYQCYTIPITSHMGHLEKLQIDVHFSLAQNYRHYVDDREEVEDVEVDSDNVNEDEGSNDGSEAGGIKRKIVPIKYVDVHKIIQKWQKGETALKELVISGYETLIEPVDFGGRIPSRKKFEHLMEILANNEFCCQHRIENRLLPARMAVCSGCCCYVTTSGGAKIMYDDDHSANPYMSEENQSSKIFVTCDACSSDSEVYKHFPWCARCENKKCPAKGLIVLGALEENKKYVRIFCVCRGTTTIGWVYTTDATFSCTSCKREHTVLDTVAEVRNRQLIYNTSQKVKEFSQLQEKLKQTEEEMDQLRKRAKEIEDENKKIKGEQRDAQEKEKSRMKAEKQVEKLSRELEKAKKENVENRCKIKYLEQMLKEKNEEIKDKMKENKENMEMFRKMASKRNTSTANEEEPSPKQRRTRRN